MDEDTNVILSGDISDNEKSVSELQQFHCLFNTCMRTEKPKTL